MHHPTPSNIYSSSHANGANRYGSAKQPMVGSPRVIGYLRLVRGLWGIHTYSKE